MKSNAILLDLFFDIKRTTTARWVCSQAQVPCVAPLQGTTGGATSTTTPPSSPLLSSAPPPRCRERPPTKLGDDKDDRGGRALPSLKPRRLGPTLRSERRGGGRQR